MPTSPHPGPLACWGARSSVMRIKKSSHPRPTKTTRWHSMLVIPSAAHSTAHSAAHGTAHGTTHGTTHGTAHGTAHAHGAVRVVRADVHAVTHGAHPLVGLRHVASVALSL